jgi:hypothetical protein
MIADCLQYARSAVDIYLWARPIAVPVMFDDIIATPGTRNATNDPFLLTKGLLAKAFGYFLPACGGDSATSWVFRGQNGPQRLKKSKGVRS